MLADVHNAEAVGMTKRRLSVVANACFDGTLVVAVDADAPPHTPLSAIAA